MFIRANATAEVKTTGLGEPSGVTQAEGLCPGPAAMEECHRGCRRVQLPSGFPGAQQMSASGGLHRIMEPTQCASAQVGRKPCMWRRVHPHARGARPACKDARPGGPLHIILQTDLHTVIASKPAPGFLLERCQSSENSVSFLLS